MRSMHFYTKLLVLLTLSTIAFAARSQSTPLVSPTWLKQNLTSPHIVILDFQPLKMFTKHHIPGAVHTDYEKWRLKNSAGLDKMLPEGQQLAALISAHGISEESHVIISPFGRGAGDMAAATRIYWTLYVAGLNRISILDGGLVRWHDTYGSNALAKGPSSTKASNFQVKLREEHILTMDRVAHYVDNGYSILDARSPEEFTGKIAGAPNERPGALPGAVNLPYDRLMNSDESRLLSATELQARFNESGASLTGPQVSYCHTGHRTSLAWFVAHEILGNREARLYDGSTLEWSVTKNRPLVTHFTK